MGIAAYNRGSISISNQIAIDHPIRPTAFVVMERINALPKFHSPTVYRTPFSPVLIEYDLQNKIYLMMSVEKLYDGFSYWYPTLSDAVRNWNIALTEYDETTRRWYCEDIK